MPSPRSLLKGWEKKVHDREPDPAKRITMSDPDIRGHYARITPAGHRSYTCVARNPQGKQVWAAVGDCNDLTLEDARALAREAVKRIKTGEAAFPKAEPVEPPAPPETFQVVHDNFITRHVEKQGLRTGVETKRIFKVYVLPKWKDRIFTEIRRGDVARLLDDVEDNNGQVMADRVLAAVGKLFNWYASREDDYSTPIVPGMGRANAKERARNRILNDDEIRLVWKVAGVSGCFGAFVQTCLLLAQRRAKVQAMAWDDIDDDAWTIPAAAREKANAGVLQLPKLALDIINARPMIANNSHVFAGRGTKAIAGFSQLKRELDAAVAKANNGKPIPAWVLHDLRRTAKSLMARAAVRPDVSERVLGHVIAGVEGVYDRHDYAEEKADALRKLAGLVELIISPPTGNVTQLKRRA